MSSSIEQARKEGYSDEEISSYLSERDPKMKEAFKEGHSVDDVRKFLKNKDIPKMQSILSAPAKGLLKGAKRLNPFSPENVAGLVTGKPKGEKIIEKLLPTQEALPEQILERAGELAPLVASGGGKVPMQLAELALGTAGGEIAKGLGGNELIQSLAEVGSMSLPRLLKAGARKIPTRRPRPSLKEGITPGELKQPREVEKFPSGLTKMKVAEEKVPKLALITKERQKASIEKLNQEAAKLTKTSIEKHLPISKQIEKGFDFEKAFNEGFSKLEKAANKYNPHIDATPLQKYLRGHQEKFRGLVDLNSEDRAILRSIQNYRTKRPTDLAPLLKNYRKNNQYIKKLIENARITGAQKDMVDYLINVNKEIADSIRKTLPADSAWMKSFDNLNKVYGGYKKALKTQELLAPVLKGEPTPSKIKALIENPKTIKRLEMAMGKEGAKEIQQIAKDLDQAIKAIKKIPIKDLKAMDAIYPLKSILGFNIPVISTIKKGVDIARVGWGHYLTTPALRKNFDNAVKAISADDISAYRKATDALRQEQKLLEYKPKS